MKKGKVQTNEEKINVLVEHEDGTNRHYGPDVRVMCEKLSDTEIVNEFNKLTLTKKEMIQILQKRYGFAVSQVHSKNGDFTTGDLFKYFHERFNETI